MTPDDVLYSDIENTIIPYVGGYRVYSENGVRPVINLKENAVIVSGNGTKGYTYDNEGNVLTGPYNIIVK